MATRKRQNTNPFMSANLGSGARTTTGGTYENPRLGIQDYTAFGSGVASTFKMPEQEEVEKKDDLTLDLGDFESDRDDFYVDSNGIMQDLNSDVSTLINNTWKGSELTFLNNAYQKALAGSQQERDIKSHLNGYSQAIGPKDSNFINYLNALDSGVHDHNVSNRFLPSLDGDNLNGTIADFIRIGNENPNAIKIASKKNKNGIMQYGYEVDGLGFVNASAMTDKWINKNFSVKYNQASSLSADYEEFQISKFKPMFYNVDHTLFKGTNDEFKVTTENEIVQDGSINSFELTTDNAANTRFSSQNDPYFKSAYYNLDSAIGGIGNITLTEDGAGGYTINYPENSKFKFSSEIEKAMGDLVFSDNISQQDQDALKINMLKDHYKENFKLTNGSNMYVKGEDGRAIAKTASNVRAGLFKSDYDKTQRDVTPGGGIVLGFGSADQFVKEMSDVLTLQDSTFTNTFGKIPDVTFLGDEENFTKAFKVDDDLNMIIAKGFRSSVDSFKPVINKALPEGQIAIFGEESLLGQLKELFPPTQDFDESYTEEDYNNDLKQKIELVKSKSKPNSDLFIIKNYDELAFNSNKQPIVDSYEVGVEKLDQLSGVVSLLDKITGKDTYSKAFVNSPAYESEQRINKAVETKDFSKLSDKEKTQAKYRIIRNANSGKNKRLFLYQ